MVGGTGVEPATSGLGSWVTIKDEGGSTQTYRIVGPDEIDAEKQWIGMDSPVGRSLLSREVGVEITVQRPKGEIIEVRNTPQGG